MANNLIRNGFYTFAGLPPPSSVTPATSLVTLDQGIQITDGTQWLPDTASGASVTTAETAAGVTPTSPTYAEGDIRRYGAIGAGEDNTAHINTVLSVAAKTGRPANFAGLALKSTGGHTQDVATTAVNGQGAIIDFSSMSGSGTAWTITASGGSSALNVQHARNPMQNLVAIGTNANTTRGLFLNAASDPTSASFLNFHNVVFEQFNTALDVGNNAYICKFFGCYFSRSANGLNLPAGLTNSAEQLVFTGCGFTDCSSVSVFNASSNTSLIMNGCSIDGTGNTFLSQASNGRTHMFGCHIECLNIASQAVPMFNIGGGSFSFDGGDILGDGTGPAPAATLMTIASGATVTIDGCPLINNVQNSGGVLASGAGRLDVLSSIKTFDLTKIPIIKGVETQFNLLSDGGFEATNISDNVSITSDVSSTVTMPIATPGLVTWSPHRQLANQPIVFSSTGTLPAAITAGVIYYVLAAGLVTGAFEIALTPGGTAINFADAGTGTHTATALVWSRTIGSHLTVASSSAFARTGTKSLAITLNGGVGSSFSVSVPVVPGRFYGSTGWYRGATTQAVTASVTPVFDSDIYYSTPVSPAVNNTPPATTGGVPVFIGSVNQTSTTLPSIPTTFTQFTTALFQAPSWAKFMHLNFNLNNMFSNTFYLDDLVINGYC
jgi:hypothetical protein